MEYEDTSDHMKVSHSIKKGIFPPFRPYHSRLLGFKIIIPTIQADNGEGPNIRGGKGDWNSDHKERKGSSIHWNKDRTKEKPQPLMQGTTNTGLCTVWDIQLQRTNKNEIWGPECNMRLCASQCFKVYHTKLHFWGPIAIKLEKQSTVIIELQFLSSTRGVKRVCILKKASWKDRDLSEGPLCVCFILPFWEQTK
jgi:hypothetical protein